MPERVVALAGGVGGSKLAFGLAHHLGERLSVVVNTGDDEEVFGLHVSPDLDTVRYTLAGMASRSTGWGIEGDTFHALGQLETYGFDTWFRLGDRDLATNLARTTLLREGRSLTEVEALLGRRVGVAPRLLPMCDHRVATRVRTPDGELAFQDYFVRRRHADEVLGVTYQGIERATLGPDIRQALTEATCVVLCPSNPVVSIGPILAVPELRPLLASLTCPRVAVSPIVGGQAVSGPAGVMMAALGHEVSVLGLARLYGDLLTGIVIDTADAFSVPTLRDLGLRVLVTNTIMATNADKQRLAEEILAWLA